VDRSGGERGVTAVAYALMVAIIAVLLVGGIFVLGGSIQSVFDHGGDCVASPSDCGDGSGTGNGGGNGGGGNPGPTTSSRPGSATTTTATTVTAVNGP
jgi:Flp pilus assembly pilin Flp